MNTGLVLMKEYWGTQGKKGKPWTRTQKLKE